MLTNLPSRPFPFDAAHRFTIEEYHRLVEEGCLEEKARSVELLDGRIVAMSPIGPRNERVVFRRERAFISQGVSSRLRTSPAAA
jgi:Uma2 family endonuclease